VLQLYDVSRRWPVVKDIERQSEVLDNTRFPRFRPESWPGGIVYGLCQRVKQLCGQDCPQRPASGLKLHPIIAQAIGGVVDAMPPPGMAL
jgi:hypothetical protein